MSDDKKNDPRSPATLSGPVLAAVDFSTCSQAALLLASDLAHALSARLVILHVVHDPNNMPGYYARMARKKTLVRMEDAAGEMLEEFVSTTRKAHADRQALHTAELLLVKGIPVTRILQVAEKQKARLLVIGSKGVTGLRHLLLGSVAEQVVSLAKVPVTVVKASSRATHQSEN